MHPLRRYGLCAARRRSGGPTRSHGVRHRAPSSGSLRGRRTHAAARSHGADPFPPRAAGRRRPARASRKTRHSPGARPHNRRARPQAVCRHSARDRRPRRPCHRVVAARRRRARQRYSSRRHIRRGAMRDYRHRLGHSRTCRGTLGHRPRSTGAHVRRRCVQPARGRTRAGSGRGGLGNAPARARQCAPHRRHRSGRVDCAPCRNRRRRS